VTAFVWLAVGLLGGLGALARFALDAAVSERIGGGFPLGTMAVNLSGAVVLGFVTGLGLRGDALLLVGTATLGSYTTFSTWMLEAQRQGEQGERLQLFLNVAGSVAFGLAAVALGRELGELL
jgi:CrcB protein